MKTHLLILAFACVTAANAADKLPAIAEAWQKSLTEESNNDYAAALESVLAFKSAGGETYLAAVRAGWLSYLNKDYTKAVQYYTTAAKQEPRALTPHLGMMSVYQAQNKTEDVLRSAREVLKIDQFHRPTLLIAGEILFNQQDYRKAEVYFERAHKLQPEDPIGMSWFGWSQINQGQARLAAPLFEKLMEINPEGYMVHDGFAITHGLPPGPPPGQR
ncbi:tetratricopeptide repeat protein [Prosthecobacter sp.]|jgi:tetratricopeptide (TPR) repeat protein|uniref:tetratricopeptide repeat protein n=1 Tax=Prosthecobacter sp. TaxID=1965333 RepID=UPI0037CBCE39